MESASNSRALSGRTMLLSSEDSRGELGVELERYGARVLAWPTLDIGEPEYYDELDESIENLFGYDWLIFQSPIAVDFFLKRLLAKAHEINELDALRVCGVGAEAVHKLEQSQVHIDVIPDRLSSQAVFDALEDYLGGREALRRLNFLVPCFSHRRDYLQEVLADVGARVDLISSYRTCSADDSDLARTNALLTGGGIDCVAFTNASAPSEFATIFDTNDLRRLLTGVAVACIDQDSVQAAHTLGLSADIVPKAPAARDLAVAVAFSFRKDGGED